MSGILVPFNPKGEENALLLAFQADLGELLKRHQMKKFAAVLANPNGSPFVCFFFNPTVEAKWTVLATEDLARKMHKLKAEGKIK